LTHALLAGGRFDLALPDLDKLGQVQQRPERIPEEQRALGARRPLHRVGGTRERFRRPLAGGNRPPAHATLPPRRGERDWGTAQLLSARHPLGLGGLGTSAGPPSAAALTRSREELEAARRVAPGDPRLLLVEAELLSLSPSDNPMRRADDFLLAA